MKRTVLAAIAATAATTLAAPAASAGTDASMWVRGCETRPDGPTVRHLIRLHNETDARVRFTVVTRRDGEARRVRRVVRPGRHPALVRRVDPGESARVTVRTGGERVFRVPLRVRPDACS